VALLDVIIVLVSCLAAFFDYRLRKIPNWLIAFGLAAGLALSAIHGLHPVMLSILGFVVGVGVLILPFAFGWIGAGDVKYLGVVGALLGVGLLPRVFFYSALVAGAIAVTYLALGIGTTVSFKEQWTGLKTALISMGRILPEPVTIQSGRSGGSVPWGVAFAAGTLLAYYLDRDGRLAGF
jgi:prepilin peptidase CpaA